MRWSAALLVCCTLASQGASSESIGVRSFSELVWPADLIARVTILSEYGDPALTRRTSYRRVPWARVTDSLKGSARGKIIPLYYHTGWVCPNVSYRRGEDVLVFAYRTRRGYAAIYWSTGKMVITRDSVHHWDLFPKSARYEDVRDQVERLLVSSRAPLITQRIAR